MLIVNRAARDEAERKKDEKRKRKRDEDDDERKTPRKKEDFQGKRTPARKSDPPSARKTRSATKKEADQKGSKQGGKKAHHCPLVMSDRKVINLDWLIGDMVAIPDERKGSCCEGHADCIYRRISQDRSDLLAAITPYLHALPDPTPA